MALMARAPSLGFRAIDYAYYDGGAEARSVSCSYFDRISLVVDFRRLHRPR